MTDRSCSLHCTGNSVSVVCSHGTILLPNWAVNTSSTSFYITLSDFYLMFLPWYKIVLIKSWLPRCDEECHWNTPAILRNTRPEHSHLQWGPMKLLQLRSLISHYGQEYRVLKSYQNMQDGAVTSDWYWLVKIKSIAGNAINQNKNWKKHDQCSWCGDPRPRGLTSADLINEAAECRHGGSASAPQQGWDNGKYFDLQPRWGTFLVKICLPGYGNNIPFLWCSQFLLCTSTTGNIISEYF